MSDHPSVPVLPPWSDQAIQIDREIAGMMQLVWYTRGWITNNSCQDNADGFVWLEFEHPTHAEAFVALCMPDDSPTPAPMDYVTKWREESARARWSWAVDACVEGRHGKYHISVSVRFPRAQLDHVVRALESGRTLSTTCPDGIDGAEGLRDDGAMTRTATPGPAHTSMEVANGRFVKRFAWNGENPSTSQVIEIAGEPMTVLGWTTGPKGESRMTTFRIDPSHGEYVFFIFEFIERGTMIEYIGGGEMMDCIPGITAS